MKPRASSLVVALASLLAPSLRAAAPELQASLHCEAAAGPGRILCQLSTSARAGELVWSDGLVVRAPAFARPLRSRFVAQLGGAVGPGAASAKFALVATELGQDKLELLARGVVCREGAAGQWCAPEVVTVTTIVAVGQPGPAAP